MRAPVTTPLPGSIFTCCPGPHTLHLASSAVVWEAPTHICELFPVNTQLLFLPVTKLSSVPNYLIDKIQPAQSPESSWCLREAAHISIILTKELLKEWSMGQVW